MKLSVTNEKLATGDTVVIGYADIIAVYDSAPAGSEAWEVADSWLRYLQLRADGRRLLLKRGGK
jgi:hypothetical protein